MARSFITKFNTNFKKMKGPIMGFTLAIIILLMCSTRAEKIEDPIMNHAVMLAIVTVLEEAKPASMHHLCGGEGFA